MIDLKKNKKEGFSLIEMIVAMGISFLLFIIIYLAYFISKGTFDTGNNLILEKTYVRDVFFKIADDVQFLNRLNAISPAGDQLEFEIFNSRVINGDTNSNDRSIEGRIVTYSLRETQAAKKTKYVVLQRRSDFYNWTMKFGHSQKPDNNGYPIDLADRPEPALGTETDLIEQMYGSEFLLKSVSFIPMDDDGKELASGTEGYDYEHLKIARGLKVMITYLTKADFGDTSAKVSKIKYATSTIPFIALNTY